MDVDNMDFALPSTTNTMFPPSMGSSPLDGPMQNLSMAPSPGLDSEELERFSQWGEFITIDFHVALELSIFIQLTLIHDSPLRRADVSVTSVYPRQLFL